MRLGYILFLLNLTACVEGLTQVAGTGSTYTVRCSAEMDIQNGNQYFAKCKPDACTGNDWWATRNVCASKTSLNRVAYSTLGSFRNKKQ